MTWTKRVNELGGDWDSLQWKSVRITSNSSSLRHCPNSTTVIFKTCPVYFVSIYPLIVACPGSNSELTHLFDKQNMTTYPKTRFDWSFENFLLFEIFLLVLSCVVVVCVVFSSLLLFTFLFFLSFSFLFFSFLFFSFRFVSFLLSSFLLFSSLPFSFLRFPNLTLT